MSIVTRLFLLGGLICAGTAAVAQTTSRYDQHQALPRYFTRLSEMRYAR